MCLILNPSVHLCFSPLKFMCNISGWLLFIIWWVDLDLYTWVNTGVCQKNCMFSSHFFAVFLTYPPRVPPPDFLIYVFFTRKFLNICIYIRALQRSLPSLAIPHIWVILFYFTYYIPRIQVIRFFYCSITPITYLFVMV